MKAYPTVPEELQERLAYEHFLKRLPDVQMGYNVTVKQPPVWNATEHMVAVHESFKVYFARKSPCALNDSSICEDRKAGAKVY